MEPFDVHINPTVLHALTAYVTPVPFPEGSPEAVETPFPTPRFSFATVSRSNSTTPSTSTADGDAEGSGLGRRIVSEGERVSTDFEKSAKTAAASVRLLASQVSLELSSYVGGPSFVASTSHIFLRAITWPLDRGREVVGGEGRHRDGMQAGPEIFARLSRVSCRVDCCHAASGSDNGGSQGVATGTGDSRPDLHGDVVLKPFDVDVHLTRPKANSAAVVASNSSEMSAATRGWHAGIYVDQLYARFGAAHARSLERLAEVFLPALAAAELAATELARRQHASARAAGAHGRATSHVNDLRVLERVDCLDYVGEAALKPRPGQAVFYGIGTPQESQAGGHDAALHDNVPEDRVGGGGWINCCEWHYWGLRRVAQVVLPYAPLCANIPLLEGLVLDSLEVELSFVDPLTGSFKVISVWKICGEWVSWWNGLLGPDL